MGEDIIQIGGERPPFVVCGFFTPDYRPLAERLASELGSTNPHHLFAKDRGSLSWRNVVQLKPDIVLEAMDTYPNTPIIFLDVDAHVLGSLEPMIDFSGDISARAKMRLVGLPMCRKQTVLHISTRSMALKPSERTRNFLQEWKKEIREADYQQGGCETAMRLVLMRSVGLAFCPIDPRYAGIEADKAPSDAIVVHASASRVNGRS